MKTVRLALFPVVILALLALGLSSVWSSPPKQSSTALAAPTAGQTAYEFVSQIDQSGQDLSIYGYLTHVNGTTSDTLFVKGTDPANRNEASALFTMQATGSIYARSVLQSIFDTDANLTLKIYYNDTPAASFDKPDSFAAGTPVATYTIRLQNILNVQSPNVGIANSEGDVVQTDSPSFTFNGQTVTFGQVGLAQHISAFGQGMRQSQEPLAVRLLTAGNAVTIGASS